MTGQLMLGLSILIILHEFGHFWAARAFGIKVEKFYLFFDAWGFKLFSFKYKDVEYGIGWLPLGGYVKIAGMIDESMDTEQLSGPPQPWEFRSKPAWQRLIVMLGGIFVNVVLGIFIFWMLTFKVGETFIPNDKLVNGIEPGIAGKEIGLKHGDRITAVNGHKIVRFEEASSSKVLLEDSELSVLRDGKTLNIAIPENIIESIADNGPGAFVRPRIILGAVDSVSNPKPIKQSFFDKLLGRKPEVPVDGAYKAGLKKGDSILTVNDKPVYFADHFTDELMASKGKTVAVKVLRGNDTLTVNPQVSKDGTIGFIYRPLGLPTDSVKYGFWASLPIGASKAWGSFRDNAKGIKKVISGDVAANKAFTGPIGIAHMFGHKVDWIKFWSLVGLLSMALAFMNLLPIPALDGGHSLFLIIEIIKGKPLGDKFMEKAQLAGFFILIGLMVFIFSNEIYKYFIK